MSQKAKKAKKFRRVPQQVMLVGHYGLRRADRGYDMPGMFCEVSEI